MWRVKLFFYIVWFLKEIGVVVEKFATDWLVVTWHLERVCVCVCVWLAISEQNRSLRVYSSFSRLPCVRTSSPAASIRLCATEGGHVSWWPSFSICSIVFSILSYLPIIATIKIVLTICTQRFFIFINSILSLWFIKCQIWRKK